MSAVSHFYDNVTEVFAGAKASTLTHVAAMGMTLGTMGLFGCGGKGDTPAPAKNPDRTAFAVNITQDSGSKIVFTPATYDDGTPSSIMDFQLKNLPFQFSAQTSLEAAGSIGNAVLEAYTVSVDLTNLTEDGHVIDKSKKFASLKPKDGSFGFTSNHSDEIIELQLFNTSDEVIPFENPRKVSFKTNLKDAMEAEKVLVYHSLEIKNANVNGLQKVPN